MREAKGERAARERDGGGEAMSYTCVVGRVSQRGRKGDRNRGVRESERDRTMGGDRGRKELRNEPTVQMAS